MDRLSQLGVACLMMMVLMMYVEVLKVVDVMKLSVLVHVVFLFECEMWR